MPIIKYYRIFTAVWTILLLSSSCEKEEPVLEPPGSKDSIAEGTKIDYSKLTDTYWSVHFADNYMDWGMHNVHDPVIRKFGNYFYSYSTDVGYGIDVRPGLQIRKSENLVEWTFVGWVFSGLPPKGVEYIEGIGATPNNSLWAPSVVQVENQYRLYYSLASNIGLKSCIGLATSSDPQFGWNDVGVVVGTNNVGTQTNGIDPSVIVTPEGEHWMVYGSSWDGIYLVQLNPETGLSMKGGDRGKRIAHRGFTGSKVNGNIEGAELIYNKEQKKYYIFIAYDWLATKYNIRVGRSDHIEGPYYDIFDQNLNEKKDNYPMIVAPYKFNHHAGWQGVSHCTVFEDQGQYYVAHQGRPGNDFYYMDMHVRQLFWTKDGWPVASPERYAALPLKKFDQSGVEGKWEMIDFKYKIVPGFENEQTEPDFQISESIEINADGTLSTSSSDSWSFNYPWLTLNIGHKSVEVHVSVGRDWENKVDSTLVFTGIKENGLPLWGKKLLK